MSRYQELITAWAVMAETNPTWRAGQALFNTLEDQHPTIAEEVRGQEFDPFYADEKVEPLLLWLQLTHPDTF